MKSIALTLAVLLSSLVCAQAAEKETAPAADAMSTDEKVTVDAEVPAGTDIGVKTPEEAAK